MAASAQPQTASTDPATTYFRDLDSHPVLGREEERRQAEALQSSRVELASLLRGLPDDLRAFFLGNDRPLRGSTRRWPLAELDACYRRLEELGRSLPTVAGTLRLTELKSARIFLPDDDPGLVIATVHVLLCVAQAAREPSRQ